MGPRFEMTHTGIKSPAPGDIKRANVPQCPSQINANLAIFFSSSGSVSPALVGCDRDIIPRHSSNLTQIVITSPRPQRHQRPVKVNDNCAVVFGNQNILFLDGHRLYW